ncbi:hypothetical protein LTR62_004840 [Meristemomyces frigidus]|uniref:NadR/Ttd14 AAA domain-containing protein n=1 Tax=Meristemomyces frigidus TaxID=1508187 RepID=A0AAN7YR58_9PEZI|nr:hypothetical protein LTR62_004840 [Meristemomyces frigidus]
MRSHPGSKLSAPLHPKVYLIGTGSTGKTTLVKALQDRYTATRQLSNTPEPLIITEVARKVLDELSIDPDDIASSPQKCLQLQTAILHAQHQAETAALATDAFFISDRSGLDPIVYAKLLVGEFASHQLLQSSEWKALESNLRNGIVFLCEAGCKWLVDEGTRLMPKDMEEWHRFDQAFREMLDARALAYQIVSRDRVRIVDRVNLVLGAIEQWPARTSDHFD